ncbi:MAG: OprO/OprP family phosphate-selective porin [Gammaproteobacteria bacterium]|nr:OprO/OprP family phosphate-selective porin [Gammaproteobacteria bacterium]
MRNLTFSWHRALPTILGMGLVLSASPAVAQSATQSQEKYQRIWRHADLYQNPGDGLVRDFSLSGRLQADYAWFDADEGDYDSARWRRFRFGFTSLLADQFTVRLEGDFDLNNSPSDFYQRLTDAHVDWQVAEKASLKVLKHSSGFTLDGITSSKKLLTPERNNVTNNLWFTAEYFTGISLSGKLNQGLSYKAGVFSSDDSDEWGLTHASYFTHTSLSYDWASGLGLEKAQVTLDYVFNDKDANANTRDFGHVVSLSSRWQQAQWGLQTDLSAGDGYYDQSDVWGLVLMPFYSFTEMTQLVLRYTYLSSDSDNGVRLNRYENRVVSGRGDEYNEYFAGLNLFFYGHKFKWQSGLQYTRMDDAAGDGGEYDGWGLTTGLRFSW